MKYLHLIDTNGPGGAQVLLDGLLNLDSKNKHMLYALRKREPEVIQAKEGYLKPTSTFPNTVREVAKVKQMIQAHQVDVLICHLPHAQLVGLLLKRFYTKHIKLVFYEHGDLVEANLRAKVIRSWYNSFHSQIDAAICVADYLAKEVQVLSNGRLKIFHLPNAILPVDIKNTSKEDAYTVGFLGRISKRKGWKPFLEVAKQLPQYKFIMTGSGEDSSKLLKLLKNKVLSHVTYAFHQEKAQGFWNKINVLLITSDFEGHPLTKLEAIHAKIPVVALNRPGTNEAPHTGVTYCESTQEIVEVLRSKSAAEMKKECKGLPEDYVLNEQWIKRLEACLESL